MKPYLIGLCLLGSLYPGKVSSQSTEPPARLSIRSEANRKIVVSWTNSSAGLELERSSFLSDTSTWRPLYETPVAQDRQLSVTFDAANGNAFFRLHTPPLTSIRESSPVNGETGVAVIRETIVHFSSPLNTSAVVTTNNFYAGYGGRRLLARLELSSDRRKATLFYLEPMPGSTRVVAVFDGSGLTDFLGRPLDADGDSQPGGAEIIAFETLSLTALTGTAVIGRVFASELVPGSDTGTNAVNKPLAGVTITVDGMEQSLRTVTDAQGNFTLSPAPPGRFFVHIDGRTVTNEVAGIRYPDKSYYPYVGKAWDAVAGRTNNLAGGTGTIYLPLIIVGTLQPVSLTEDTPIGFPSSVVSSNPALAGVSITVPANSLFADDGTRGGMVGIAPVPPDRLPGPLPPGLEFPIVITVQSDGPLNFDKPAPICFPNLPDPVLGTSLPPGSKQALISFNHKKGIWEAVGNMTVSADGKYVCSDPGTGILQPGWNGFGPKPKKPKPCDPNKECCQSGGPGPAGLQRLDLQAVGRLAGEGPLECGKPPCKRDNKELQECFKDCDAKAEECNQSADASLDAHLKICEALKLVDKKKAKDCVAGAYASYKQRLTACLAEKADCVRLCNSCYGIPISSSSSEPEPAALDDSHQHLIGLLGLASDPIADKISLYLDQISNLIAPYLSNDAAFPDVVQQQITDLLTLADSVAGGDAVAYLDSLVIAHERALEGRPEFPEQRFGNAPSYPVLFAAEILRPKSTLTLRGATGPFGDYQIFIPRDGRLDSLSFYDPATKRYGLVFPQRLPEAPDELPRFTLRTLPGDTADTDKDGLPDLGEYVFGTDPTKADTDGDGIPDGAEVEQGTDPLDGLPAQTGIIATAKTPGSAVDVCAINNLAIVAEGTDGVSVLNVFNGMNPTIIAQVNTPGSALRVACSGNLIAVADGPAGLAVIDITDPASARISRQVALGGSAQAVVAVASTAYVGLSFGGIVAVDMLRGEILDSVNADGDVHDLGVRGEVLYALTLGTLETVDLSQTPLRVTERVPCPGVQGNRWRLRMFVADDLLYTTHAQGYNTFNLADALHPTLIKETIPGQFYWKHIVLNGSGLALAAHAISTGTDTHELYLYDLQPQGTNHVFLNNFNTPGIATAVSIYNGLAYVADDVGGVQVINYLPYDAAGKAPTIALTTSFPASGVEEGKLARATARVSDDVQVRTVEFYVDGTRVLTDGNYPFEHGFITSKRTATKTSFTLRARATDTGGNWTWSDELTVPLLPDQTPPQVVRTTPAAGAALSTEGSQHFTARFSELLDPTSVTANAFTVLAAGADGVFGTGDDLLISGVVTYRDDLRSLSLDLPQPLAPGPYRVRIAGVTDLAGNPLAAPVSADFSVVKTFFIAYGRTDGTNGTVWIATADGAYDQPITTGFQPRFSPDGRYLAFRRGTPIQNYQFADLYVRDLATGAEQLIYHPNTILNTFDWFNDSSGILIDLDTSIFSLPRDGSTGPQNFLSGADAWDDGVSVNPVTGAIAFWNVRPGNPDAGIHTANAGGGERRLVPGTTVTDLFPAWSADGEWISFLRTGPTNSYYRIRPDGSGLAPLTANAQNGGGSPAIWAPDRIYLYAPLKVTDAERLYRIPADGSSEFTSVPISAGDEVHWVGSVQARRFNVVSQTPGLGAIHAAGLVDKVTVVFANPVASSTITAQSFRLVGAGADGVFDTTDDVVVTGQVSLRADQFAATLNTTSPLPEGLYRAELAANIQDVTGLALGLPVTWTFRVQKETYVIAYGRAEGDDGTIWLANADGSNDQQITAGWLPRLSRDGRYLAFVRGVGRNNLSKGQIWTRDLQTGDEQLIFGNNSDVVYFDWQPDDSRLIFDYSGGVSSIARDGSGGQQNFLLAPDGWDDAPAVNPLDSSIAFQNVRPGNPDAGLHTADATGGSRRRIPNTGQTDSWPDWSSDGQWISFKRFAASGNYFKIRPDGSEPTQLTSLSEATGDGPAIWTPDGSALLAPARVEGVEGLYRIPASGGLLTRIPLKPGPPVHWVGGAANAAPPKP